jgi:hypothetical protein
MVFNWTHSNKKVKEQRIILIILERATKDLSNEFLQ